MMRALSRRGREAAVVPLEWRAGRVAGQFTPRAARQGLWAVAHLTPQEAAGRFREVGNLSPSKSRLDRLPKACSAQWEARRQAFEAQLRETLRIPATAVTVAVSLAGVMTPMKDGARRAKREAALVDGKRTKGPAGYPEVGCATLSFYDAEGARWSTLRMARMPEPKKATVRTPLAPSLPRAGGAYLTSLLRGWARLAAAAWMVAATAGQHGLVTALSGRTKPTRRTTATTAR